MKVLDAGCRNEEMALYFANKGSSLDLGMCMRVSAIDILPEKVSLTRHNVEYALPSSAYKYSPTTNEVNALNTLHPRR